MNKKKISIIAISIIALIIVGLGFNMLFSNANKSDKVSGSNSNDIAVNKNNEEDSDKEQDTNVESEDDILEEETNDEVDKKDQTNEEDITEEVVENTETDNSNNNSTSNDTNNTTPSAPVENNNNPTVEETKPTTPVQPEVVKETVTISISCKTAINSGLNSTAGFTHLPSDGMILYTTKVEINEGDTVFNILQRITKQNGIHMEYTGSGSTIYIEGINNLYEFDGGQNSGWMYSVNGWYPNYGCGSYTVKANDVIQWNYTLDLGNDLGAGRN